MSEKESVHEILSSALDADENGDKERAVELYSKAVEMVLKISDASVRAQLNKYAVQALERAEELRGISSLTHKAAHVDEGHASQLREHGKICQSVFSLLTEANSLKCVHFQIRIYRGQKLTIAPFQSRELPEHRAIRKKRNGS